MARRLVTLEQKAEALAVYQSEGCNARAAERKTGFDNTVILRWFKSADPALTALSAEKLRILGGGFTSLTERLLERAHADLDQLQITDRNFVSLLGVSAEKALLFAGQPTSITENRNLNINLVADCEAAIDRYAQYCDGDRDKALIALREDDPEMVAVWEREQSTAETGDVTDGELPKP